MGTVSQFIAGAGQASQYDAMKRQTLAKGRAEKNKAYAEATATEEAARQATAIAGENMMRERVNQRRAAGEAQAAQAARGFTTEGTGDAVANAVSRAYDMRVGDMAFNASTNQSNAINQAIGARRAGDEAMRAAESEAAQYRRLAKGTRSGLWINGITSLLSFGSGAFGGSGGSSSAADSTEGAGADASPGGFGAAASSSGTTSPWLIALQNADSQMRKTSNLVGGVNPYLSSIFRINRK